jgi:hypothetical protein
MLRSTLESKIRTAIYILHTRSVRSEIDHKSLRAVAIKLRPNWADYVRRGSRYETFFLDSLLTRLHPNSVSMEEAE